MAQGSKPTNENEQTSAMTHIPLQTGEGLGHDSIHGPEITHGILKCHRRPGAPITAMMTAITGASLK